MFMGAKPVLRERDGMVTSAAPEGGKPGWQQPQSVAAESGPPRNKDPSDWCLPACLTRPPCLPASCLRLRLPACLLAPPALLSAPLQTETGTEPARPAWAAAGPGLAWSGALGTHDAVRCDATGRDGPYLNFAPAPVAPGNWHLSVAPEP